MHRFSYNQIDVVGGLHAPQLKSLDVRGNRITRIDSLAYLKSLQTLNASSNHLMVLSSHIKKLVALTNLDLSDNFLGTLALPEYEMKPEKSTETLFDDEQKTEDTIGARKVGDRREWEEAIDPFDGKIVYFCKETKEVRRVKPPGFDEAKLKRTKTIERNRMRDLLGKEEQQWYKTQKETEEYAALSITDNHSSSSVALETERPQTSKTHESGLLSQMQASGLFDPSIQEAWIEMWDQGRARACMTMV